MPNHAGFAAVAQVRERALQEAVRIYHSAGLIPSNIAGAEAIPNPLGGGGQAQLQYALFLDAPRLLLAAANGGQIAAELRLFGDVTITPTLGAPLTRAILLTLTVQVGPSVQVVGGGLQLRLAVGALDVTALDVQVLSGGPLPQTLHDVIHAPGSRVLLSRLLRTRLASITSMAPPLEIPMASELGLGTTVTVTNLVTRVLDGALAIAVDLGSASVTTHGDAAAIVDFLNISDIAACLNPILIPVALARLRPEAVTAAVALGITLDSLDIAVEPANLRIFGHAAKDGFGGAFSMRVRPKLGRPNVVEHWEEEYGGQYTSINPGSDDLWLDVYDVELHEELPWWVYIAVAAGCVIVLPAAPVILATVASIIDSIRGNITRQLETQGEHIVNASRTQRASLPGTTSPLVDFTVSQLRLGAAGLQSRLWFRPSYGDAGRITGPNYITPEAALTAPLRYRLAPAPNLYAPNDPLVRIRWQVRRPDTNAVVLSQDLPMQDPAAHTMSLDLALGDRRTAARFTISCRVYRPNGAAGDDLINQTISLQIHDRLDRTHPYVRWTHHVYTPQVELRSTGQRELTGYNDIERKSAIHRTAVPGRCRFADHYSPKHVQVPEYLDVLPFPTSELVAQRRHLCDYCFFGGPDKTTPKIPI